jgi:glycosyltransferase involved in cell wall biosynthesis
MTANLQRVPGRRAPLGPAGALRLGLYTTSLPQSDRKPGGADVFVDRLADHLARRGHDVTVFSYSPLPSARGYRLRPLSPALTATSRPRRLLVAPARLNTVDTSGLDVLHLHGDDWFYVRRRVPTVRTFHGSAFYEARYATRARRRASQYLTYGLELVAARLATRSYGVTPGYGLGYRTAGYLPLAVELPAAQSVDRSPPPTILFVGTWGGRKRGSLLHRAFLRDVLPRVPDARLVMVSDHCQAASNVEWFARPSDHKLADLYRSAWVLCLPSSYEGFGLPYLEAMANGTPVVATSNPGSRFVLDDGRYGLVCAEDELGRRIAALLLDDAGRKRLAEAGVERAAQFSWEDLLDRHERAYRDAIAAFHYSSRPPS